MAHSESTHLGLVAVTASGVRFYFRTATGATINQRPTTLALQHIRLPPGFTASQAAIGRPSKVHISYYNNGTYDLKPLARLLQNHLFILCAETALNCKLKFFHRNAIVVMRSN